MEHYSFSKTWNMLDEANNGPGPGSQESWGFPRNLTLSTHRGLLLWDPRPLCASVCDILEMSWVLLVQHCLSGFLLTLFPFCDSSLLTLSHFCPAHSLWDDVLLNKLVGLSHQFMQTSWPQLSRLYYSSHPGSSPSEPVTEEEVLIQVTH